ncbi:uncharacterized protein LOC113317768 [Papaver somniferum]|uniref:uncharacterized protein LOC113317768 n=1 Tax=Papaver somniferum TaxID=3469 RepID=UPI000E6FD93F|nr:uncharacterized protein LOC113317768 [Papaver somniferum]XP_026421689.1 uncharacterized protein LOC113317768 [Papaver somniferum]XP_026421690.1 uncharacterized protein LOC113317768 [Papaver somniferum]
MLMIPYRPRKTFMLGSSSECVCVCLQPLVVPEAVEEVLQEVKAGKYWFSIYLLKRRILNFWWSFTRVLQEGSDEALFDCFYLMINSGAWWLVDANIPHQKYQY